jgi:hypothetical protein
MTTKFALLVAVENYQDKKFASVTYAENDASELSSALRILPVSALDVPQ